MRHSRSLVVLASIASIIVGSSQRSLARPVGGTGLIDEAPELESSSITTPALSPVAPDERFFTSDHPNLNTWFYASSPPLIVPVDITRVFSRNGLNYSEILTGQPQLIITAYDVDFICPDPQCELDEVFLNGQPLGYLAGQSGVTSETVFNLDAGWFQSGALNDAHFNGSGVPSTPGQNEVQILVNVLGGSRDWRVKILSVELRVQAMRPAVLIHGIRNDSSAWDTFKTFIPGDLSLAYDVNKRGRTTANGKEIRDLLPDALTAFGVSKVNLIGHSKASSINYLAS